MSYHPVVYFKVDTKTVNVAGGNADYDVHMFSSNAKHLPRINSSFWL